MCSTRSADVHNQGSAVTSDVIKMHKGPRQGHANCFFFFLKNRLFDTVHLFLNFFKSTFIWQIFNKLVTMPTTIDSRQLALWRLGRRLCFGLKLWGQMGKNSLKGTTYDNQLIQWGWKGYQGSFGAVMATSYDKIAIYRRKTIYPSIILRFS